MTRVANLVASEFARFFHRELKLVSDAGNILPPLPQDLPMQAPSELRRIRKEDELSLA
jgi:hypothetical protein